MPFWEEIKQRVIVRLGMAYLVVAWFVLQLADIVVENTDATEAVVQWLLVGLTVGFPLALIAGWLYEIFVQNRAASRNFSHAFTIFILLLGVGGAAWFGSSIISPNGGNTDSSAQEILDINVDSIAVLPFETFSETPSDQYFADGLADTLLHKLAQLPTLTVISRNSSFQYRGQNLDARKIGAELEVDALVEGTVQRSGTRIRVIAQIIRTSDGSHAWSGTFDEEFSDVFVLQDQIAVAITEALQLEAFEADLQKMAKDGTDSPEAFNLVMQVRGEWDSHPIEQFTPETDPIFAKLNQALTLDPDYALALTLKSDRYGQAAFINPDSKRFAEYVDASIELAKQAIASDPEYAYAYTRLGFGYWRLRRIDEARSEFDRASQLDPNETGALTGLALIALTTDRPQEARQHLLRIRLLDPAAALVHRQLQWAALATGDLPGAIEHLKEGIARHPREMLLYGDLARLYRNQGQLVQAAQTITEGLRQHPQSVNLQAGMVMIWNIAFDIDEAQAWQTSLENQSPNAELNLTSRYLTSALAEDYSLALETVTELGGIATRDSDYLLMHGWLCRAISDLACLQEQADKLMRTTAPGGEANDSRLVILTELFRIAAKETTDANDVEALQSILSRTAVWPTYSVTGTDLQYTGYIRVIAQTLLGDLEAAAAELLQTLEYSKTGIVPFDFAYLPPDRNPFLNDIKETKGYQEWLAEYSKRRSALREQLKRAQREGTVARPSLVAN